MSLITEVIDLPDHDAFAGAVAYEAFAALWGDRHRCLPRPGAVVLTDPARKLLAVGDHGPAGWRGQGIGRTPGRRGDGCRPLAQSLRGQQLLD